METLTIHKHKNFGLGPTVVWEMDGIASPIAEVYDLGGLYLVLLLCTTGGYIRATGNYTYVMSKARKWVINMGPLFSTKPYGSVVISEE